MSWNDNYQKKENVLLFTNRYRRSTQNHINGHQETKQSNSYDNSNSSESESNSDSDSNETSSSGEFLILDDYTTLKSDLQNGIPSPNSLKRLSNTQTNQRPSNHHQSLFLHTTKSLPIIFERSDESSICSQSTAESTADDDGDSTLSNCSTSSSSSMTNEFRSPISKETENLSEFSTRAETANNSCHISVSQFQQPIGVERISSIDFSDKSSRSLFQSNDFLMNDSLNGNQTTMCNDNISMLDTPSTSACDHMNDTQTLIGVTHLVDTHTAIGVTETHVTHQLTVPQWTTINKSVSLLSQPDFIVNKRTPRFPVKNQYNRIETSETCDSNNSDNSECDNNPMDSRYRSNYKPPISQKPTKKTDFIEPITDLDDLIDYNQPDDGSNASELPLDSSSKDHEADIQKPGSYFKNQMFKNYTKTDLQITNNKPTANSNNRLYERRQDQQGKVENNTKPKTKEQMGLLYQKDSPSKRSQELVGNVVKMDKTINHVTNDIVRIDNAIDKLSQFNKSMMSNLELMSDAELSSDFETHSFGGQTDDFLYNKPIDNSHTVLEKSNKPPINNKDPYKKEYWNSGSSGDDSSTEKESSSDSEDSIALKPSPVHQRVDKRQPNLKIHPMEPKTMKTIQNKPLENPQHLKYQESDLSSLPESSICEEPEKRDITNQVKYFQRQIKKSAGLYKHLPNVEPPKKLVVEENLTVKHKSPQKPIPKPRNSLDGTLTRHMSNSSSESSNYDYNGRTLSNSNNHTQISPSPGNSDSGSILSLNSNHFERKFQKGAGASARYNTKTKPVDKWGTTTGKSHRGKLEEEVMILLDY